MRVEHRTVALKLTWNDDVLPALAPLDVWRADPCESPRPPGPRASTSPSKTPRAEMFTGKLLVGAEGRLTDGPQCASARGKISRGSCSRRLTDPHQVVLADEQGKPVARDHSARFEAMTGFPAGPESSSGMDSILFVDNAPQSPRPLTLVRGRGRRTRAFALEVPYHFDPGWRYLAVAPRQPMTIPAGASGAIVWVRGNQSGDSLRCRFHDATGQTFQVDLSPLDVVGLASPADRLRRPGESTGAAPTTAFPIRPYLGSAAPDRLGPPQASQPQSILAASPFYIMER